MHSSDPIDVALHLVSSLLKIMDINVTWLKTPPCGVPIPGLFWPPPPLGPTISSSLLHLVEFWLLILNKQVN